MDAPQRKTNVSPRKLKTIKTLHADGVGVREIARRVGLSPTTVYCILNLPLTATPRRRCPTCGALIEGEVCLRCALMRKLEASSDLEDEDDEDDSDEDDDYEDEADDSDDDEDDDIRLKLRPAELARYWQVRPLVEARYAKMAEMREKLNREHDAKERRDT